MHHDSEVFAEPEQFNPDRFNDGNVEFIRPYTYLPFGAGPRNCIGMRLALQSIKLCLLHSVHVVQFVPTKKTKVPLQIKQSLGTLRIEGAFVGIRKRLDNST
nr:cytochrome P450 3A19-like [Rhipicephalus microplus]